VCSVFVGVNLILTMMTAFQWGNLVFWNACEVKEEKLILHIHSQQYAKGANFNHKQR